MSSTQGHIADANNSRLCVYGRAKVGSHRRSWCVQSCASSGVTSPVAWVESLWRLESSAPSRDLSIATCFVLASSAGFFLQRTSPRSRVVISRFAFDNLLPLPAFTEADNISPTRDEKFTSIEYTQLYTLTAIHDITDAHTHSHLLSFNRRRSPPPDRA